jgi:uncharacterized membrane protein YdjX (TVP38/TMEM64 family)/rhodanese-related sulfurtransferase
MRLLGTLLLVIAITGALVYRDQLDPTILIAWVNAAGPAGPLIFIGIYAAATVLFMPGSVLTLAGGALFGPIWGAICCLTGSTLGAALAFLIARYLAGDWVQARAKGMLGRLIRGVEAEGWRFVAFTRLVPLFPFNLLNYALGLTRIPFRSYLLATLIFMLPGALAYSWLGFAGRQAITGGEGLIRNGLIALALLATVVFLPQLLARLRQRPTLTTAELKRRLDAGDDLLVLDVRAATDFIGEQGHIAGATNVALEDISKWIDAHGADHQDNPIALVSCTDRRSAKAAALLTRSGFTEVHVVQGGMTAWLANGWPVQDAHPNAEQWSDGIPEPC